MGEGIGGLDQTCTAAVVCVTDRGMLTGGGAGEKYCEGISSWASNMHGRIQGSGPPPGPPLFGL